MRLGVLDIGSNTGHLLVVDAHGGAAPLPAFSYKQPLRLAEHLDATGAVTGPGSTRSTDFCREAVDGRRGQGLRGHARLRDLGGARRGQLRRRPRRTSTTSPSVDLSVLSGEDEARLTFLAVRRWFGWSPGPPGRLRHRRRLAGDRRRRRRGARRRLVGAARRGPPGPRLASAAPARRGGHPRGCAGRSAPTSPATPATCCAPGRPTAPPPPPRPSARWRASAAPRRAATGRWSRAASSCPRSRSGSPS